MSLKIYVASSWKNKYYPDIIRKLQKNNYNPYDFRIDNGFQWDNHNDSKWDDMTFDNFKTILENDYVINAFETDFTAVKEADVCILVLPCGRSAHMEAGYVKGKGGKVFVYQPKEEKFIPELMYRMFDIITDNFTEILLSLDLTRNEYGKI